MDEYIEKLVELIKKCENCINRKGYKEVLRYYKYGEYEIALEGLIIELIISKKISSQF